MKTLREYIKSQKIPVKRAAVEIGISRQWLHTAIAGHPVGKSTAKKIEKWTEGKFKAVDLMHL